MSDSQRPSPPAPSFEVPDLELEPVPRSLRQAAPVPARPTAAASVKARPSAQDQLFGVSFDFGDEGDLADFELERSAQPNLRMAEERAPRAAIATRAEPAAVDLPPSWPTGRAPDPAELKIDPLEIAILADYGDPPDRVPLTPAYAYRVFIRQRELKRQLVPIALECERAQSEREATLAELSRAVRPAIEKSTQFRRLISPLLELSQRASERGQALSAINAQLGSESGQLDAELAQIAGQRAALQLEEREAQRQYDDREATAKHADAKWKRVQIEIRAVMNVAEQKLGPAGGQIPDPEAAQLASLRQRAEGLEPEVKQTRVELDRAKQGLGQLHAQLDALRQGERQITRKKQALTAAYQKELSTRSQGVSETEIEQRAALAELARAILAARGTVEIPEAWLERVRGISERADKLLLRSELQRRAITSYDAQRARQGVRLACTAVALLIVLFAFKLIF
ncbi:MAG: hypothetical protein WDO74_35350 [Pseudomonadota bacterium]